MGMQIFESSGTFSPTTHGLKVGDVLQGVVVGGGGGGGNGGRADTSISSSGPAGAGQGGNVPGLVTVPTAGTMDAEERQEAKAASCRIFPPFSLFIEYEFS